MKKPIFTFKSFAVIAVILLISGNALSFCGFYVATADSKIFNKTSQVILVREGKTMTVTMSNDFKGDVKNFAMVVPVPVVLGQDDITTVTPAVFDKLDSYSGPRLVEYYDDNPCTVKEELANRNMRWRMKVPTTTISEDVVESAEENHVTIEAVYEVDEYDILILSAKESVGLKNWLTENDYKIPEQAEEVLEPYIKNDLKFFVVKVDTDRLAKTGSGILNPLQIRYESDKFMLPIRLGMANADGFQDMIVYGLTKEGRIECTNYRTMEIPSNRNVPTFVRDDFSRFYKDLFDREYERQGENAVFLEYAWNVTPTQSGVKCDPCVGPPPIFRDLAAAGVRWNMNREQVFFTRMHVRYTKDKFPQDLLFQVTPNKERFQARYILTNPASGSFNCKAGQDYLIDLVNRRQRELDELQVLAGWDPDDRPYYVEGYRSLIKEESRRNEVVTPFLPKGNGSGLLPKLIFSIILLTAIVFFLSRALIRNSQARLRTS